MFIRYDERKEAGYGQILIGINVSKATFNYCVKSGSRKVINGKAAKNNESIKDFFLGLKEIPVFKTGFAVFGMENTGIYGNILMVLYQN